VESERSRYERGQVADSAPPFPFPPVWGRSLSVLCQNLVKLFLGIYYGCMENLGMVLVYVVGVHFLLVLYIYYKALLYSLLSI
jgi:hypothetical protein